jgi:hypothetical protein
MGVEAVPKCNLPEQFALVEHAQMSKPSSSEYDSSVVRQVKYVPGVSG